MGPWTKDSRCNCSTNSKTRAIGHSTSHECNRFASLISLFWYNRPNLTEWSSILKFTIRISRETGTPWMFKLTEAYSCNPGLGNMTLMLSKVKKPPALVPFTVYQVQPYSFWIGGSYQYAQETVQWRRDLLLAAYWGIIRKFPYSQKQTEVQNITLDLRKLLRGFFRFPQIQDRRFWNSFREGKSPIWV